MKPTAIGVMLAAFSVLAMAQDHPAPPVQKPELLQPGIIGHLHHPISTTSAEAQKFFDQGLTLIYAFNHEEAIRSFHRAAELDPKSPMPWWGAALALGPNYNVDVDPEREKAAYDAIQKALVLAANAPAHEREYCEALARRYSNDPKADYHQLALAYRNAMRQLAATHPDDPDAVTLYAESMMDLNPWHLWSNDGKPAEGTLEIVAALESVLREYPEHVGANHFYIHALEASPHPEQALESAKRLGPMVPAAGHLVHMPAHIFIRTGDYESAAKANVAAASADREFIKRTSTTGSIYDLMYYSHNLHFLASACSMEGNYACAHQSADQLAAHVTPGIGQMEMLEWFLTWQPFVAARFGRWDAILAAPAPAQAHIMTNSMWHYARGLAFSAKGEQDQARAERKALEELIANTPLSAMFGFTPSKLVMQLSAAILDGKIAAAGGDSARAIEFYKKAVELQDQSSYDEPPDWYYPVRETLGAALLAAGDAAKAEEVFREDLKRNPRNGRSLFGLEKALAAQNKTADAAWVGSQFKEAWQHADVSLDLASF